jgi:hypothetical protein
LQDPACVVVGYLGGCHGAHPSLLGRPIALLAKIGRVGGEVFEE